MSIKLVDTAVPMNEGGYPVARAKDIWFEDNTTLQDMSDNGSISGVELTQAEYDALTDEEKKNGLEYRCTDSGRIYINDVLYSRKKEVELETYEEYKALEEAGLVEADVDYVVHSNQSGVLLGSEDISYKDKTVHETLVTLQEDVTTLNVGVDKKESVYITNDPSGSGILYNAAEYLGVNSVDAYGLYNLVVTTDTGESGEVNFIYKHRVATYGNIISENGVTFSNLNEYGTIVVDSTSANRTFKVKYLGEPTEDMSGLSKYEYTRANKNALVTTRSLTLKSGYKGYITEIYDPTTKVVVYNININGTFKGLGNAIATGFKVPNTASSGADVMVSTIGIYGAVNATTGDAQFTRLLIRSYSNPFLDVDAQGNYEISGTITYITV